MSFRQQMPQCAAFFDAFKAEFGGDVTLVYAQENGITRGKPCLKKGFAPPVQSPLYKDHGKTKLQWYQANIDQKRMKK